MIVPLMRRKFVEEYHWIDEKEMIDMVAIAQSSPGAMAVNASILVGYRLKGIRGALISVVGTVLPPLVILSVISMFYVAFRDNPVVAAIMKGMQAGVAAVIGDVVYTMGLNVTKEKNKVSNLMMPIVFIASYLFQVNVMILIIISGIVGILHPYIANRWKWGNAS